MVVRHPTIRYSGSTLLGSIVGVDGCGKTSTFTDTTHRLAQTVSTIGIGDVVLSGEPNTAVAQRTDIPLSRSARAVGAAAKGLRKPNLYKDLKLLEFTERTHIRRYLLTHDAPRALLTDGDPLVNVAAWAIARYSHGELMADHRLLDVLHYLAGDRKIPLRELGYYLRHGWQLALLNRLGIARFGFPDMVFLLQIDPATAMQRICARGRPLQIHENAEFLSELAAAYERVCHLLETRCGVHVVRLRVDDVPHDEVVAAVAEAMLAGLKHGDAGTPGADTIAVIATTMSGSFEDQRKVSRIGPALERATDQPIAVHTAPSHGQAQQIAQQIVAAGGRTIVSAGGAGTFNAVLEGCHVTETVPPDLRLAFLRKGSADLIGKALHVPDQLPEAALAIARGIEANHDLPADILRIDTTEPNGATQRRHMVGFGGLGIFGDVPRFTESRFVKFYKGFLGTVLGDLGPFYFGLALAMVRWWALALVGRVSPMTLTLDDTTIPAQRWSAVILLNGDLGKDFPLGRGLPLASGTFRVVALRYTGIRAMLRQLGACRTAAVLDDPDRYDAVIREVRTLSARPSDPVHGYAVNVDGLRLDSQGTVQVSVSGRVQLVDAAEPIESTSETADETVGWNRR